MPHRRHTSSRRTGPTAAASPRERARRRTLQELPDEPDHGYEDDITDEDDEED